MPKFPKLSKQAEILKSELEDMGLNVVPAYNKGLNALVGRGDLISSNHGAMSKKEVGLAVAKHMIEKREFEKAVSPSAAYVHTQPAEYFNNGIKTLSSGRVLDDILTKYKEFKEQNKDFGIT